MTSVCEITSVSGSGSCGQNTAATGFLTKYSYDALDNLVSVTQNAQGTTTQTRAYTFDALGRLDSETNGESGTTSYTYDSDSTCSTYNGDLVRRVDAVGNVTCYAYDGLHRLTSKTYPIGSYASVTPSAYFIYDSATVDGTTVGAGGLLAEACTGGSGNCGGTPSTILGFKYSARGEVTDTYESTPNSNGFYHGTASYWANGLPYKEDLYYNSGSAMVPEVTYTPDGEGRAGTVSEASGQSPLASASYNVFGEATGVTFGSGDADVFNFDPSTGRMTQYIYYVGTYSVTGDLTWNGNGTLGVSAITDTYNSNNSQDCGYLYDDLARISSVNCGSLWSQNFSYTGDTTGGAFGNLSKSGTSTFAASFSPTSNQVSTAGLQTFTYDANGNLLSDGSGAGTNAWTWDSEGRMHSITPYSGATRATAYDALGRFVELQNGNGYSQNLYGPLGNKAAILYGNGQTLGDVIVPLPGGAEAYFDNSATLAGYFHPDWEGSIRMFSSTSRTVSGESAYGPFGEQYAATGIWPNYAGIDDDTVSTMYDAMFRKYPFIQGRWLSPDPAGLAAATPANPQTWNRYAYSLNRPTNLVDPIGLDSSGGEDNGCSLGADGILYCGGGDTRGAGDGGCAALKETIGRRHLHFGNCQSGGGASGGDQIQVLPNLVIPVNLALIPPQFVPCGSPNWLQSLAIEGLSWLAQETGATIGFGVGGSFGFGAPFGPKWNSWGIAGAGSRQLVASPNGTVSITQSFGTNTYPNLPAFGPTWGVGGTFGIQVSVSNASSPTDLSGKSFNVSFGGGDTWGGGGDISIGSNGTAQGNATGGFGWGGFGGAAIIQNTDVSPPCTLSTGGPG